MNLDLDDKQDAIVDSGKDNKKRQVVRDEANDTAVQETEPKPKRARSKRTSNSSTKKQPFVAPLVKFAEQVEAWQKEEKEGVPPDEDDACSDRISLAHFRSFLCIGNCVSQMPVRAKRRQFFNMRTAENDVSANDFLPSLAVTTGQLCTWQILARANTKRTATVAAK